MSNFQKICLSGLLIALCSWLLIVSLIAGIYNIQANTNTFNDQITRSTQSLIERMYAGDNAAAAVFRLTYKSTPAMNLSKAGAVNNLWPLSLLILAFIGTYFWGAAVRDMNENFEAKRRVRLKEKEKRIQQKEESLGSLT